MKIEKRLTVDGSPGEIWKVLWDVERIAGCIRGSSDVTVIEPHKHYSARITQRVGPFQVSFPLDIEVLETILNNSITVVAAGKDTKIGSRMKATMRLSLQSVDESRTVLDIDSDVALQGRIAALGQGIISRKADEELDHFSRALERELHDSSSSTNSNA